MCVDENAVWDVSLFRDQRLHSVFSVFSGLVCGMGFLKNPIPVQPRSIHHHTQRQVLLETAAVDAVSLLLLSRREGIL